MQTPGGIATRNQIDFGLVDPMEVAALRLDAIVLEAHFSSIDHPLSGDRDVPLHVPGAIQVHPSYLEAGTDVARYYPFYDCPADGNLLPDRELQRAVARLGITPDSTVVVYGSEPDGAMAAARLCWGLLYAGVKRVRMLDGGIDAWLAAGGATASRIERASDVGRNDDRVAEPGSPWRVRPELLATTSEVRALPGANARLVDVRKRGEWDGTLKDYYTFFSEAGHIPHAILQGDWTNLLDPATRKLGPQLAAVARRWRADGILDAGVEAGTTTLVFYCGTGWRSSLAFLAARLLGLRAKNYEDGFYGWSRGEGNEIALGASPACCVGARA